MRFGMSALDIGAWLRDLGLERYEAVFEEGEIDAETHLARLLVGEGERTKAFDLLGPVYEWFGEGFNTVDLVDAKTLLDELA